MSHWFPAMFLWSIGCWHYARAIPSGGLSASDRKFLFEHSGNHIIKNLRGGLSERDKTLGKMSNCNNSSCKKEALNENPSISDIHLSRKAFHLIGGLYFAILRNSMMSRESFVKTFLAYESAAYLTGSLRATDIRVSRGQAGVWRACGRDSTN